METVQEVQATLPYPISVNKVWLRSSRGMYLNPKIEGYRKDVYYLLCKQPKFNKLPLRLEIKMYPPDNRPRDIDNILKTLLDTLQHAGIYDNDSQIYQLYVEKHGKRTGGEIEIKLTNLLFK